MGLFDSKVYGLNPEVVLLAASLVGRSGILQEGENCALLRSVYTHPVCPRRIPGPVQADRDQTSAASRCAPAHSSSVSSLINMGTHNSSWGGRGGGPDALIQRWGGCSVQALFNHVNADTWHLVKRGKVPQGCLGPACRLLRQTGILLGCRPQRWFSNEGF